MDSNLRGSLTPRGLVVYSLIDELSCGTTLSSAAEPRWCEQNAVNMAGVAGARLSDQASRMMLASTGPLIGRARVLECFQTFVEPISDALDLRSTSSDPLRAALGRLLIGEDLLAADDLAAGQ